MTDFGAIPAGPEVPERVNVVVEVSRGDRSRYEFKAEFGTFRLVDVLPSGREWPLDYGFIPSTVAEDGYPLDAFVILPSPAFPGAVISGRPVAVLHRVDEEGLPDHKIVVVPEVGSDADSVRDLADIPPELLRRIEAFYGERELSWEGAEAARDTIFKAWEGFLM